MHYPKYDVRTSDNSEIFEFTSVGIKGEINKIVEFEITENPVVFNLAFGDKVEKTLPDGSVVVTMDDTAKSENGDRNMVLATVASIVFSYSLVYTERWIYFTGNNEIKTRLYRMAITKNYEELSKDFHIFGIAVDEDTRVAIPFKVNTSFIGFIIKRK